MARPRDGGQPGERRVVKEKRVFKVVALPTKNTHNGRHEASCLAGLGAESPGWSQHPGDVPRINENLDITLVESRDVRTSRLFVLGPPHAIISPS